jgi:hypothetical protein
MGKGSDPPPAPDYTKLAKEQAAANLELARYQTEANRANQFTPYGSLTWEAPTNPGASQARSQLDALLKNQPAQFVGVGQGRGAQQQRMNPAWQQWNQQVQSLTAQANAPGGGQWTQRITPTPEVQRLIDGELQMSQQYSDLANNLFGSAQQAYGQGFGDFDFEGTRTRELDKQMQRMQPDLNNRRSQLESQLINQGVRPGSEAYDNAMRNFNDEVNRLRLSADIGAGSEAERALRMQNYMQDRPLSIVNALRTGAQPTQPQFGGYSQQGYVPGPDLLGAGQAQYGEQLGAWNANQQRKSDFWGGLMKLGTSFAPIP